MSDTIKLERGKTVMYPNMYPKLLITPVFGRRNIFMWVEEIRCCWDAESSGKGNEFAFVRAAAHYEQVDQLEAENAKLREQMERLVTLLRVDCDIDASWDGLRRFWNIELTESGCLMRDRVCKAEAENAKLRELLQRTWDAFHDATAREFVSVKNELRELGVEVD